MIFDGRGKSNTSRESITDSKCEWKVLTFFFKAIFALPNDSVLQKYGLQLFQKCFEWKK